MLVRRIGIDFGTSTTVFAYKDYDKKRTSSNSVPKLLELGGRVMFPSIIFEPEAGARVYGFDAEEESRIAEGTLYTNFKMDLLSEDPHDKVCELIVGYFKYLRDIYKEDCNRIGIADEEETWLSYPAAWPGTVQLEMKKIAQEAGFVNVNVMDEPTAAVNSVLFQYKDQLQDNRLLTMGEATNVLMIDMGAGTTDLVVCRFIPGDENPVERLLSWPPAGAEDYFGGREIDDRLTDYCIEYCEKHNYFHRDFQQMKKRMSRNVKKWKEGEFSRALQTDRKPPVPEIVESNVPDVSERKDFEIVDRESFEKILAGFLETFPKIITDCASELQNMEDGFNLFTDTDLVILTGGNSLWYFIDEYILGKRTVGTDNIGFTKLQNQPERLLRMGKPQQTVAYGLALNEKIIKSISEQFKIQKSTEKNKKSVNKGWKKPDKLYYKQLKDLEPVVELVNEAAVATGDSTKVLSDSPMANAVYLAGKGMSVIGAGSTIGAAAALGTTGLSFSGIASAALVAGNFVGGAAVAGAFVLAAPIAVLGVGGSLIASRAKKNQLHNEKQRLLEEVQKQIENVKNAKDLEQDAMEERKRLLDALETGLAQVTAELQNDLGQKKQEKPK